MTLRRIAFVAVAVALVIGGQVLRAKSGIEINAESLSAFVERQGWLGPFVYVLLVTVRQFILVPSAFLLSAGGLLFGAGLGSILGAIGVFLSSVLLFALARGAVGEAARERLTLRYPRLGRGVETTAPFVVFLTIAYPLGVITPVILAAGLSAMRVGPLLLAALLGGAIRSATFSIWGASMSEFGSTEFWVTSAVIWSAILLPLAHPGFRRRLRGLAAEPTSDPE